MKRIFVPLFLLAPSVAMAHAGHDGFLHPFTGADHLLAMTGVGLWAALSGGRARWALPLAFLTGMAAGPLASFNPEPMVLASVILLGAVVALGLRLPLLAAVPVLMALGLAHGAAHASEGAFGLPMLAATALLQGAGLALGLWLNRPALRGLGLASVAAGVALALGA